MKIMEAPEIGKLQKFTQELPIFCVKMQLMQELSKAQTFIVIGETGSGKTTQLPQYILEAGLNENGKIAITQPRRVAAISLAKRVAAEMEVQLGKQVGYSVRFEDVRGYETKINFLTDGMLLRETLLDSLLKRYSVVILDEVHERTVQTDILFGIVKAAQAKRASSERNRLKVIVMSATMDVDQFSKYFNSAPVLYIEGRQYPVQVLYTVQPQSDYVFAALVTLFQIHRQHSQSDDVLIFLTGQEEIDSSVRTIQSVCRSEAGRCLPKMLVLPLYAALPAAMQLRVFDPAPPGVRKVVVSTNIAETSITISGIRHVIDCGRVKAKVHTTSGLDLLRVVLASKQQCVQRSGRAGRESPGTCYRLYTEDEFDRFSQHTMPELQRCNLGSVVLQLLGLNISKVMNFDFIDPPHDWAIANAVKVLHHLQAVEGLSDVQFVKASGTVFLEAELKLTPTGRQMLAYPVMPALSKAILLAPTYSCLEEMLTIISLLSVDSIFVRPSSKKEEAEAAWERYMSSNGDHLTLLNIGRAFKKSGESKHFCDHHFFNQRSLTLASSIRKQLRGICVRQDLRFASCGGDFSSVRKCLAAAFFTQVAELQLEGDYKIVATGQRDVAIHPLSALARSKPGFLIYHELVKTSKCYMRIVTPVESDWLMEVDWEYFKSRRLGDVSLPSAGQPPYKKTKIL